MQFARTSLLVLLALAATQLGTPRPAGALPQAPSFNPTRLVRLCEDPFPAAGAPKMCTETAADLAPNAPTDYSTVFQVPWGHLNFGSLATFSPPDAVITPGTNLPLGAIVGGLRSATTLGLTTPGLTNARCYPGQSSTYTLEVSFTFMNATTNTGLPMDPLTLVPPTDGSEGALEPYRNDVNGNGLPDHVDFYPSYLNKIFDPDRIGDMNGDFDEADSFSEATAEAATGVDFNGDTDILDSADLNNSGGISGSVAENGGKPPLTPLARYSSTTVIAGTAVVLEFIQFEPGQLAGAGFDANNPFSELDASLGYPSIVVLNDPTQPLSPSAITDFCSPLTWVTVLYGQTRDNPCTPAGVPNMQGNLAGAPALPVTGDGVGCLNSNIPCIPGPCTAAQNAPINSPDVCANEVDDDGDTFVNDGCPFVGAPEAGGDCASGEKDDDDGDFLVNDGCAADGTAESLCAPCVGGVEVTAGLYGFGLKISGGEADDPDGAGPKTNIRAKNPPAGTGIGGSGTHLYASLATSLRDVDEDGFENAFDTCPYAANMEDGRIENGPVAEGGPLGGDMIDSVCDAFPAATGSNVDGDVGGGGASGWANAQDNCPQIANGTQYQTDLNIPRHFGAPNGGTVGDSIGDACDITYAAFSPAVTLNGGIDSSVTTVNYTSTGDPIAVNNLIQIDSEAMRVTAVNTGTNGLTVTRATYGLATAHTNGTAILKGDTTHQVRSDGHWHAVIDIVAKCVSASLPADDTDGDGFCDALETTLGSASGGSVGESAQSQSTGAGCTGTPSAGCEGPEKNGPENQCTNALDDDGDTFVNDGCPAVGGVQSEAGAQCTNAVDDDATDDAVDVGSRVNDGCPVVGGEEPETGSQCLNDTNDDPIDDPVAFPEGVNDGCPQINSLTEFGTVEHRYDPASGEDGGGVGTCSDGIDNGGGGARRDMEDADCYESGAPPPAYDPTNSEDGAGADSCGDGVDNPGGGDTLVDQADVSDCFDSTIWDSGYDPANGEDGGGVNTCSDSIDNGGGGGRRDFEEPECYDAGVKPLVYDALNGEDGAGAGSCADGVDNPGEDSDADQADHDDCYDLDGIVACSNAASDDDWDDAIVNDGCDALGVVTAEVGTQCADATDQDPSDDAVAGGSRVNDGCPAVGGVEAETGTQCANATDDDSADDAVAGLSRVNDGCPTVGQCDNATDDDGDNKINDGCPADGAAEFAERCENALDDDGDGRVNDGCFSVGHGNCGDGVDNDSDGTTDGADAGCRTPESYVLEYGLEFTNLGAGPDADKDTVPDNDEPAAGPAGADNDALDTAGGQQEEPHQVCTNDVNEDQDATRDANATLNEGGADGTALDTGCSLPGAGDTDSDGVINASDNCASAANPTQSNFDGDATGDACDTDMDGDGSSNSAEWIAGSLARNSNDTNVSLSSAPETGNAVDDDRDGATDEPTNTASTTAVLTRYNPVTDRDGDGWTDDKEVLLGTNNRKPCGTTGFEWPGDMPPSAGEGDNTMDIGDINSFVAPFVPNDGHGTFAKYNHQLAEAAYGAGLDRWRLDAGDVTHAAGTPIQIGDINALTASAAATARPPMFGGALKSYVGGATGGLAFFSGVCPYP